MANAQTYDRIRRRSVFDLKQSKGFYDVWVERDQLGIKQAGASGPFYLAISGMLR